MTVDISEYQAPEVEVLEQAPIHIEVVDREPIHVEVKTVGLQGGQGIPGPPGPPMELQIDEVTTLDTGQPATASLLEEDGVQKLSLGLPRGLQGIQGPEGPPGAGNINSINGSTGPDITLTKSWVGLDQVDNTSDENKPVSNAQQAALDGKASLIHTHPISDITGLQAALDGKAAVSSTVTLSTDQTITGAKTFSSSDGLTMYGNQLYFDMTPYNISWARGVTYKHGSTIIGGFGMLGTGSDITNFYISTGTSPWDNPILEIAPTAVTIRQPLTVPDNSFTISKVSGLQEALNAAGGAVTDDAVFDIVSDGGTQTRAEIDAVASFYAAQRAAAIHTHTIADVTGLQTALNDKASISHSHEIEDINSLEAYLNGMVSTTGAQTISGVKTFSSSPVVPDASWSIAKTSGLQSALDAKAADNTVVKLTGAQTIAGIKTFSSAPVVPDASWTIAKTSGLQTALDGKAATSHTHTIANITGLQTALDAKAPLASPTFTGTVSATLFSGSGNSLTDLNASNLSTGTVAQARLVPNVVRVLHGSTAGTARPAGATYVEWVGSVQPTNAQNGDTWVNTA